MIKTITLIMNKEQWKDILGYEGIYQVSNEGNIRSVGRFIKNNTSIYWREGSLLCPYKGGTSIYYTVSLSKEGNVRKRMVHRLVAQHFLNDWNEHLEVNHKDGDKLNNNVSNLEMCDRMYNIQHSITYNLKHDYGENSKNAKLTNSQINQIRELHKNGVMQKTLANMYGVCKQTICNIIHYKRYSK